MASNFPKLPGFVPTHDPTLVDHKKISHVKLEQIRNGKNVPVPLYSLPRASATINAGRQTLSGKPEEHKSLSQTQYTNPFGTGDIAEQFEPTWVKLDKQVSNHQQCTCATKFLRTGGNCASFYSG
jgi:EF-hand domain-containing protein 1